MNTNIKITLCILLISFCAKVEAGMIIVHDSLPYLRELHLVLFPPDDPKVPAYLHPDCTIEGRALDMSGPLKVDSSVLIRATQPDQERVCALLLQIAQSRDYRYFTPLMAMYEQHQAYFKAEWEYIRQYNKYGCNIADLSIQVMHAFEHALYALELSAKNTEQAELERLYYNHIRNFYEYVKNKPNDYHLIWQHRQYIDSQIHYYSSYFKKVRSMKGSWAAYSPGFGFYTVFLEELEDYIIQKVLAVDGNSFAKLSKDDFEEYYRGQEVLYHIKTMKNRKSRRFEQALEAVFEELVKSGYIVRVFEYAQDNTQVSPEFVRFLLDQIYTHEMFKHDLEVQETFTGMMGYLLNTHTRPVIKQYLLERTEAKSVEDRQRTWSYLVYFTNDQEVLQLMLNKSKDRSISKEEAKVLRDNFDRMLKASDFPEAEKKNVQKHYNQMPHEKKQK